MRKNHRMIGLMALTLSGCASIPCSQDKTLRMQIVELADELKKDDLTIERAASISKKLDELTKSAKKCGLNLPA